MRLAGRIAEDAWVNYTLIGHSVHVNSGLKVFADEPKKTAPKIRTSERGMKKNPNH
jgi:hypothetical protein